MRPRHLLLLALVAAAALALSVGASAKRTAGSAGSPIPAFTPDQLTAQAGNDWAAAEGNYQNARYSTLTDINASNAHRLHIAWHTKVVIPTTTRPNFTGASAESNPVEYGGVLYMPDSKFNVWAIDATTGERLWFYKPKFPKGFAPALGVRGVAIGEGKVFYLGPDATLAALDQSTGRLLWKRKVGNWKHGDFFSAAGTYYNGHILTGMSGGDFGSRCFVASINAKTGRTEWKFYVIPDKGEPGYGTWPKNKAYNGGAAIWNTPAVDPKLGLVYVGVGNPVPYSGLLRGPGQELFTESVLALHLNNGKYAWHFQAVHHDIWDYDFPQPMVLADLTIKGQMRQIISAANKTGWLYILDRKNGKPVFGIPEKPVPQNARSHTYPTQPYPIGDRFAKLCASKHDYRNKAPDGQPYKVGCLFTPYDDSQFVAFAPAALGGVDWPPSSYSPQTGFEYICSKNSQSAFKSVPQSAQKLVPRGNFFQIEGLFAAKKDPAKIVTGRLVAMNLRSNRIAWQRKWPGELCYSGVMTTAGGLVVVGRANRHVQVFSAKTGRILWTSPVLAADPMAPAITYRGRDGKQYIVIYAGGNAISASSSYLKAHFGSELYAFALS